MLMDPLDPFWLQWSLRGYIEEFTDHQHSEVKLKLEMY